MAKIQRLSADQRLNLVAYLDGELDDEATQEIERVLSGNPVARHDLEIFTRTWELLDELPRYKATEDFTERTIASLQVDKAYTSIGQQAWFQKTRRVVLWGIVLAALVAGGVAGFLASYKWYPQESDLLIEHLPVVENIETYRAVGNVEFLTLIKDVGQLNPEPEPEPNGGDETEEEPTNE